MQGQRAQIRCLPFGDFYSHDFTLSVHTTHAHHGTEIRLCVKACGEFVRRIKHLQRLYAVECIDVRFAISVGQRKQVPSLLIDFYTVRTDSECGCFRVSETLVCQQNTLMVAHRLDDRREKVLPRRDILEQNLRLDLMALVDEVVHCKSVYQPSANAAFVHLVGIENIVAAVFAVALDDNLEQVFDSVHPVEECAFGNFRRAVSIDTTIRPFAVDFLARYMPRRVDSLRQPYIVAEEQCRGLFCHRRGVFIGFRLQR